MTWEPAQKAKELLDEFRDYVVMEPRHFAIDLTESEGLYLVSALTRSNYTLSVIPQDNGP